MARAFARRLAKLAGLTALPVHLMVASRRCVVLLRKGLLCLGYALDEVCDLISWHPLVRAARRGFVFRFQIFRYIHGSVAPFGGAGCTSHDCSNLAKPAS